MSNYARDLFSYCALAPFKNFYTKGYGFRCISKLDQENIDITWFVE
jgi:hypothetical protein